MFVGLSDDDDLKNKKNKRVRSAAERNLAPCDGVLELARSLPRDLILSVSLLAPASTLLREVCLNRRR